MQGLKKKNTEGRQELVLCAHFSLNKLKSEQKHFELTEAYECLP